MYGEEFDMDRALEVRYREGIKEGREEGREEGIEKGREEVAVSMLQKGFKQSDVMQVTGLSSSKIEELTKNSLH
jgi:predicted transposase/invertase (TIGR01784 family)